MLSIPKLALTLAPLLGLGLSAAMNTSLLLMSKRDGGDGEATYYYQEGAAGSCGDYNPDTAYIGALSTYWMDNNWGWNYCNAPIAITATSGPAAGSTVNIVVQDTCEGCDEYHIGTCSSHWFRWRDRFDLSTDIRWHRLVSQCI